MVLMLVASIYRTTRGCFVLTGRYKLDLGKNVQAAEESHRTIRLLQVAWDAADVALYSKIGPQKPTLYSKCSPELAAGGAMRSDTPCSRHRNAR